MQLEFSEKFDQLHDLAVTYRARMRDHVDYCLARAFGHTEINKDKKVNKFLHGAQFYLEFKLFPFETTETRNTEKPRTLPAEISFARRAFVSLGSFKLRTDEKAGRIKKEPLRGQKELDQLISSFEESYSDFQKHFNKLDEPSMIDFARKTKGATEGKQDTPYYRAVFKIIDEFVAENFPDSVPTN
jgi:hypothetical protein